MRNELVRNDFFDNLPAFFGTKNLLRGFNSEFDKILNGKCDFEETEDKYTIELEVPGVKKDEIVMNFKDDILTISWSRKNEKKSGKGKSRYERSEGSFSRSFDVEGTNPEKIEAELKNGVLKVVLNKHENAKPQKIEIN